METRLTLVCFHVLLLRLQLDEISISPGLIVPGNHRNWDYLHFVCFGNILSAARQYGSIKCVSPLALVLL